MQYSALMRVLITGGTGFIGSNLALTLHGKGHEVLVTGSQHEQKLPDVVTVLPSDLFGINWDVVNNIDALFHQAAITDTSVHDREHMFRTNVEGAQEVFRRAIERGCSHIVYASSTAVYGNLPAPYRENGPLNPLNPYAESKALLDEFAMRFADEYPDVRIVGLRYCNVYGPGESHKGMMASMIYRLARQMQNGNPHLFKYGEQKRDYIYVKDVVRANLLALAASRSCVVNCATGTSTSFNELVALLNAVLRVKREPEYIYNPRKKTYQSNIRCDMSRAQEMLNFMPAFTLEQGIKDYFESGFLLR